LITTIHDVSFDAHPEFIKKTDFLFLKTLIPLSLRRADNVIAVSNFTKKEITKYYKILSDKIHVIYNGDAARGFFQEVTEDQRIEISKQYELKDPFIFHIGTLQPRKNIPFLLKSFQLFQESYSQENSEVSKMSLYLTGDLGQHNVDQEIKEVLDQIQSETPDVFKKIKFLGYVDEKDLPIIFKMAKFAVSVSLYEGFGLPVIESMTAGTPIISNNESCLGEIAGGAVETYQQNDRGDLAKKIFEVTINKDLRERLIQKGIERSKYFKWEKCAQETLELYKSLGK
jgi:glycosyltransferase involved in cell wall biosynthesis